LLLPHEYDEDPTVFVYRPTTLSDLLVACVIGEAIHLDRFIVRLEFHFQGRLLPEETPARWATSPVVLPSMLAVNFHHIVTDDADGDSGGDSAKNYAWRRRALEVSYRPGPEYPQKEHHEQGKNLDVSSRSEQID
jgi:hypothetical protein